MDGYAGVIFALVTGLMMLTAAIPLMRRMIRPNRWYGYRNRATLNDELIWYAVNAQTGKHLTVLGGVLICCGIFGLSALHDPRQQAMLVATCIAVIVLGLTYSLISGWRISQSMSGNHLEADRPRSGRK